MKNSTDSTLYQNKPLTNPEQALDVIQATDIYTKLHHRKNEIHRDWVSSHPIQSDHETATAALGKESEKKIIMFGHRPGQRRPSCNLLIASAIVISSSLLSLFLMNKAHPAPGFSASE